MSSAAIKDEHFLGAPKALSWPLATALAIAALLAVSRDRLLADPDILWHLETARWMVAHRALPHADPFSHTMAGAPWIAKEWLAQLAFAGAYALAGWTGVALLAACATAAAFGLLLRFLLDVLRPACALALTLAGLVLAAPHLLARPHVLAFPLIVVWAHALYRAVGSGSPPPWRLLPVMVLWANLHGGFTLGLALIVPAALEAVLDLPPQTRARLAWRWAGFFGAAALCATATPYGYESLLVTGRILGLGEALRLIGEWRPQDFGQIGAFELFLLGGTALALTAPIRLPWPRALLLIGLIHLALAHVRNDELLGLVAPILLAGPIAQGWVALTRGSRPPLEGSWRATPAAAIAFLLALAAWTGRQTSPNPHYSPVSALAAARSAGVEGTVFNDLGFGGFLIREGVPPFVDGRLELYGESFLLRHNRATSLADWAEFPGLVASYGVGWTLLEPASPLVGFLDRSPAWRRIHADSSAVVHVRRPAVDFR